MTRQCVYRMLQLEEDLLRQDKGTSWLIVNDGIPKPTVVMGISGKEEKLVDVDVARHQGVDLVKRFTGGGTVVLDEGSILVSLICEADRTPDVPLFPRPLMRWSKEFYDPIFSTCGDFKLSETDYTFGDLKFGGNAQYISKRRWLHHTSFLWDYDPERMKCLLHPPKEPEYRKKRTHLDFLCKLKDYYPGSREAFIGGITDALEHAGFEWQDVQEEEVRAQLATEGMGGKKRLQSTKRIPI
ncbi:BPL/LPL catalytic domain-containing protein [Chloropicon primus]|uniref:BPL/LPL catalytic domain-containing protein n=2 Tax=Chloropicon primus TaxID=1764295 RepID=A0A5B8MIQ4_9CHLO|nr:hypothetical protein A3770_03p20630 [Chloropicon primus]UPQ98757.1 BPL/LPL catalytic domain-containing protein [Chloropicon primus]|eukprot:QDZ19545.1 hypothetical protein A3770_03p20630 [Chloropicon primus]